VIDYQRLEEICKRNSRSSADVVDRMIHYIGRREKLDTKLAQKLTKYKQIVRKFESSTVPLFTSQYIGHCIFRANGLIHKYLNHREFKDINEEERAFLELGAAHPWRYSFSVVEGQPADAFYEMQDVFSGEKFLLYSPGAHETLKSRSVVLWYNLIGFNGHCWQSFGPIGAFAGLESYDVYYYTAMLMPDHWPLNEEDIINYIDKNPVAYFMLLSVANLPFVSSAGEQMVHMSAEYDCELANIQNLKKDFTVEYNQGIYRLKLKKWDDAPHFATAYFDENEEFLRISAMTEIGYRKLVDMFNKYDYDLSYVPDFRVNPAGIMAAKSILKKDLTEEPYESLFRKKTTKAEQKNLDQINHFLKLLMPEINSGRKPDLAMLAKKAGIDLQTAKEFSKHLMDRLKK
jgi:hypothetical protein